jgi:hypothetical protein
MSEITKVICPGFVLKINKRLSDLLIDFNVDNKTEFVFLFQFTIKDHNNIKASDDEMEKYVQVLPNTCFCFMQVQILGSFSYKYEYKYQKLKPETQTKKIEVTSNLEILITQQDMEQKILFELNNKSETEVHFELTVLELSGIRSFNGKNLFIVEVPPNRRADICELYFDGVWSYKYSYTYAFSRPDTEPFGSVGYKLESS